MMMMMILQASGLINKVTEMQHLGEGCLIQWEFLGGNLIQIVEP
jgi:hypothetical protein